MKLELQSRGWAPSGQIEWSPEDGTVTSSNEKLVAIVLFVAETAREKGHIRVEPHPSTFKVSEPLSNQAEFAAVCGTHWEVPPELAEFYPEIEDESHFSAIN